MRTKQSLNLPAGSYELPLVLYDRIFDHEGQLFYPVSPIPEHPWMDEVAGDAMVVNGRVQPFHEVEPRRYRLRVLNAANGRFFRLGLSNGAASCRSGRIRGCFRPRSDSPLFSSHPGSGPISSSTSPPCVESASH